MHPRTATPIGVGINVILSLCLTVVGFLSVHLLTSIEGKIDSQAKDYQDFKVANNGRVSILEADVKYIDGRVSRLESRNPAGSGGGS